MPLHWPGRLRYAPGRCAWQARLTGGSIDFTKPYGRSIPSDVDTSRAYQALSHKTAQDLRTIAQSQLVRDVSRLSLPQIDAVVDLVARVIPAGNVPGAILSGLARLPGRRPPPQTIQRDIHLLFRGVEHALDQAVYGAFFAGPAAVIWGYQNLLKLAGKDPEESFPEGTWQFYVDYALREDTARHANETHGFDTLLRQHQIHLSPVDRLTARVMAAIHCLHQYDDLLANEWRERVTTALLRDVTRDEPEAARYADLYRECEKKRPYARGSDVEARDTYPVNRQRKFHQFLEKATRDLREGLRRQWLDQIQTAEEHDLPAYQRQMSILAYLDPGPYGETRTPVPLSQAHVGVIFQGRYALIPACVPGAEQPADVTAVRAQVATWMTGPTTTPPAQLALLARTKRAALAIAAFLLMSQPGTFFEVSDRFTETGTAAAQATTPGVSPPATLTPSTRALQPPSSTDTTPEATAISEATLAPTALPVEETPTVDSPTVAPPTLSPAPTVKYPNRKRFVLYYDDNSLYLLNLSDSVVSIYSVAFERLDAVSGAPLDRFDGWRWAQFYPNSKPEWCMAIEILSSPSYLRPPECTKGYLSTRTPIRDDPVVFWTAEEGGQQFRVLWTVEGQEEEVARCEIGAGTCEVFFP